MNKNTSAADENQLSSFFVSPPAVNCIAGTTVSSEKRKNFIFVSYFRTQP